jgi:hypothetical protein
MRLRFACLTLLAAFSLPAAPFVTVGGTSVVNEGLVTNVADALTVNFDLGTAPTTGPIQYNYLPSNIQTGSVAGITLAPTGDASTYLSVSPGFGNPVTITFNEDVNYFGFYASSLDPFNTISFYEGNSLRLTMTGSAIITAAGGTVRDAYVNIFALAPADNFNKVVLASSQAAFETDNHSFRAADGRFDGQVPESSTFGLSAGAALSLLARFRRRRGSLV